MRQGEFFLPDRKVKRPWGELTYNDTEKGRPLILIHGGGRNRSDWVPVLPALARRRCILPDLRGHGDCAVPTGSISCTDMADDILALADKLWLGKFDLAGHGLGGLVAGLVLKKAKERIQQICLLDCWSGHPIELVRGEDPFVGLSQEQHVKVEKDFHDTYVRWMPSVRERFWESSANVDLKEILVENVNDVCIIIGDRSRKHGEKPFPDFLGLEQVRGAWSMGCGHYPLLVNPSQTGKVLKHFFEEGEEPSGEVQEPPTLLDLMNEQ